MAAVLKHISALSVDENLVEGVMHSLEARHGRFLRELRRCRQAMSEKGVHDLRVATRRLIAVLDLSGELLSNRHTKPVRRELRNMLKAFGPLRDTQVQLLRAGELVREHPGIEPFRTMLLMREQESMKRLARRLRRFNLGVLNRRLVSVRREGESDARLGSTRELAAAVLLGVAARRFARVAAMRRRVSRTNLPGIHQMRVAFKKFRYTMEALKEMFPAITSEYLKAMNAFQDGMGAIQDNEVFTSALNDFVAGNRTSRKSAYRPVLKDLRQEHRNLVASFIADADRLFEFWGELHLPVPTLRDSIGH